MNRTRDGKPVFPVLSLRQRTLVLAVCAAMPALAQAQALQVDPRLVPSAEPQVQTSAPAAADGRAAGPAPGTKPELSQAQKTVSAANKSDLLTTQISAGRIDGQDQISMRARGNVRLERGGLLLTSDALDYDQVANEVTAQGNVRLLRAGDQINGPRVQLNLDTLQGEFETPDYVLQRPKKFKRQASSRSPQTKEQPLTRMVKGSGQAELMKFEGENHYRLTNATYTTCPAPDPSWYLRVKDLELDYDLDKGEATHSTLVFKGVPIAYSPWADFPLSGGRQSGFLPPTLGATSNTGFDSTLPYYFNLASNYDATLAPRWMSERGLQFGGEFRYLNAKSRGDLSAEYLDDNKTEASRSLIRLRHQQDFGFGLSGTLDATEVSDREYFADLSSKVASTSQSTLSQQAGLNYSNGSWLSGGLLVQRYQVLSGLAPYNRQPQVSALARQYGFYGLDMKLPAEYTSFSHSTPLPGTVQTQPDGRRTVLYPQLSYPMQSSAFFLTPKVGLHYSHYEVERPATTGASSYTRSVPIMSVDTGVVFERETSSAGVAQIQTLEPRLYYTKAQYRDQSQIPVFDTAKADFNFAQIFAENAYSGSDRIADSNQLTAGLQSRMIEAASGEEWLRAALAQRFYFADQRVSLPDESLREGRVANVLAGLSGRVNRDLWAETVLQYDPRVGLWQRGVAGLRFQPDFAKVASVSYRYQRDQSRNLDVSAQWPMGGRWYGVGRYDRNLQDHRASEVILGLEYKGDCWVFRSVWQTLATTAGKRNNTFFLQLELSGLASVGSNPVSLLKRSVSGYGKIGDSEMGDPMFGGGAQP